jgi:hypothetical protein
MHKGCSNVLQLCLAFRDTECTYEGYSMHEGCSNVLGVPPDSHNFPKYLLDLGMLNGVFQYLASCLKGYQMHA